MPDYSAWNTAIADHFTANRIDGAPVFLSVDDDALELIGRADGGLGVRPPVSPASDFEEAVRSRCVDSHDHVDLSGLQETDQEERPLCVGFLAAMVLAAHRMASEEEERTLIDESDYFTRLRAVLGIEGRGRPKGLTPAGREEPLWDAWSAFLVSRGFLPTARAGEGPWAYISYPISQTLLRDGDKDRIEVLLRRAERDGIVGRHWDQSALSGFIRDARNLPQRKHLRELLEEGDPERIEAFESAVFEVFSSIDWDFRFDIDTSSGGRRRLTRIVAGLYRVADLFSDSISYRLYPRRPHYMGDRPIAAECPSTGAAQELVPERPGWYYPAWEVSPDGGVTYSIDSGALGVNELILPRRDFWVLVRDPHDDLSGAMANWHSPRPAEEFLLLCHRRCSEQVGILKQAALLTWSDECESAYRDWVEYRNCMVLSRFWDEAIPMDGCDALIAELTPRLDAGISFDGGLRIPTGHAWIAGYEPTVSVYSHSVPVCSMALRDSKGNSPVEVRLDTNEPFDLPTLPPGTYNCEARAGGRLIARRALRILSWELLTAADVDDPCETVVGDVAIRGAVLRLGGEAGR